MKGSDRDSPETEQEKILFQRSNRNLTEKRRRDRFNVLVYELAGIVSPETARKLDKTTALELALNFFRDHQASSVTNSESQNSISTGWQPSFTADGEFNLIVSDALDCFVLAIESNGNIIYASQSILSLLGHLSTELIGTNIFSYTHKEDSLILWSRLALMFNFNEASQSVKNDPFAFRIKCGAFYSRSSHQFVTCQGAVVSSLNANTPPENSRCLVIVGKLEHPQANRIVTSADCSQKQFSCRFSMDLKYVYIDERASAIIGFLPFEVLGTSLYEYCDAEDVFNIALYHKLLVSLGKVTTCFYKHFTKGQSWVWLRSSFHISYNQWNSKPEAITCTTTAATFDEICAKQAALLQHDKNKFLKFASKNASDTLPSAPGWTALPPSSPSFEDSQPTLNAEPNISRNQEKKNELHRNTAALGTLSSNLFHHFLQTPGEKFMDLLNTQNYDTENESDGEYDNALLWLENLTLPSGLTNTQITTHLKLQEEYRKIAKQITQQEKQLKVIRRLIEYSRLLLELGMNLEEYQTDSETTS